MSVSSTQRLNSFQRKTVILRKRLRDTEATVSEMQISQSSSSVDNSLRTLWQTLKLLRRTLEMLKRIILKTREPSTFYKEV